MRRSATIKRVPVVAHRPHDASGDHWEAAGDMVDETDCRAPPCKENFLFYHLSQDLFGTNQRSHERTQSEEGTSKSVETATTYPEKEYSGHELADALVKINR